MPKGKYGFFILVQDDKWTLIFNKTWDQWGAFGYKEADDVLRVPADGGKAAVVSEKLTYVIDKDGTFHILWADKDMHVQIRKANNA